jgi:acetolactate decarboxylase
MPGMPSQDLSSSPFPLPEALQRRLVEAGEQLGLSPSETMERALNRLLRDPHGSAVYLSSPVDALMKGLYEENTTIGDLKRHGDFGLGTFNDLDGEMVMVDGKVYQLRDDGGAYEVGDDVKTPFACVTFFRPMSTDEIDGELDYAGFKNLLDRIIPSENMFFAIRIDGEFEHISGWTVPKQECQRPIAEVKPCPFEYRQITGMLAGFYAPRFIKSFVMSGYHLHFLSADRRVGGHLYQCRPTRLHISLQFISKLELSLPITLDYLTAKLL